MMVLCQTNSGRKPRAMATPEEMQAAIEASGYLSEGPDCAG
jgi:hypothetical protein